MNHFTRLIDLTTADEDYVTKLATSLAPCILRPRTETSLTMEERHAYRLIRDLFVHKDAIFSELKRMSTQGAAAAIGGPGTSPAAGGRPRAISTDESNRKAHTEERHRALLEKASGSRSRATSPAPSPRGHRRDRSSGGPETRFPIQPTLTSPTTTTKRQSIGPILPKRTSLEVPDYTLSHPEDGNFGPGTNGGPAVIHHIVDHSSSKTENESAASLLEKRNSLGRSGARFVGGRRVPPGASTATATTPAPADSQQGVTLVDRPMDY